MKIIRQAAKFGTVGLINTGLTLAIIYLMANALHIPYLIANAIGYIAGFINSFVWNRAWTFRAADTGHTATHFLGFCFIFGISYGIQLLALITVLRFLTTDLAIAQISTIIIFTGVNFLGNNLFVFREKRTDAC